MKTLASLLFVVSLFILSEEDYSNNSSVMLEEIPLYYTYDEETDMYCCTEEVLPEIKIEIENFEYLEELEEADKGL